MAYSKKENIISLKYEELEMKAVYGKINKYVEQLNLKDTFEREYGRVIIT